MGVKKMIRTETRVRNREWDRSGDYESTTEQKYLRHISESIEDLTHAVEDLNATVAKLVEYTDFRLGIESRR